MLAPELPKPRQLPQEGAILLVLADPDAELAGGRDQHLFDGRRRRGARHHGLQGTAVAENSVMEYSVRGAQMGGPEQLVLKNVDS